MPVVIYGKSGDLDRIHDQEDGAVHHVRYKIGIRVRFGSRKKINSKKKGE
jgi:hypothetical protein